MSTPEVQYVSNEEDEVTGVLVPITVWQEIASELETQYLLSSPVMRDRLLRAMQEERGIPLSEVLERLGISEEEIGAAGEDD